jgi:UDPglucose--hexose-1-phosphate uridylyltransferase
MPEFRQNKASKEWVIVASERGKRPSDFAKAKGEIKPIPAHNDNCPFCRGNEHMTPPPLLRYPEQGDWRLRVVVNKFAALQPDLATTRTRVGEFLAAKGFGIAEVVIECPEHNKTIATMTLNEVADILKAYRERQTQISQNENINLVTIFRNHGAKAGTSLEHPHSQIIATPIVPPHVRYPMEQAILHYDKYGSCVYCDIVREELEQKERIIYETDSFATFCPYAARTPFELRIYPKRHTASFMDITNDEIEEMAWVLRNTLLKIYKCLDNPDYNYVIRSSPIGDENTRHQHWYMVIIPKITTPAGFEIGSGIYINTVPPEASARYLRDVKLDT